jgi:hypothetical protein
MLETQYYRDYPVRRDVSSWTLFSVVDLGGQSATVTNVTTLQGYDCWVCEIDEDTTAYYDQETGLFIRSRWSTSGTSGSDFWMATEEIDLSSIQYAGLYAVEIRQTGIILSAIFAELAVITWLIFNRLQKKSE